MAHVYYRHYFANKIIYDVKRDIVRKILQIQGNCSEKEALNVLTYDVRNFADMVIFVPNQIFLIILSAIFTFIGLNKARDNVLGVNLFGFGLLALPKGLVISKTRLNEFLARKERNDIQNNLVVKEPIAVISFQEGQLNHLTGVNGFGKSTIISLLTGLYKPSAGKIIVNNNYQLSDLNLHV
ncbi:25127_t:CDS:2 [Cetraspora pellucida]|uniref:25127_t:CDS:1 n=1 Tax=Cetraspora pellucida TaxID=1433469 RepID=A0A9N9ABW0_9GLOM|nr:25127_t:CDS:2 [Cetraspora pellucida]